MTRIDPALACMEERKISGTANILILILVGCNSGVLWLLAYVYRYIKHWVPFIRRGES